MNRTTATKIYNRIMTGSAFSATNNGGYLTNIGCMAEMSGAPTALPCGACWTNDVPEPDGDSKAAAAFLREIADALDGAS